MNPEDIRYLEMALKTARAACHATLDHEERLRMDAAMLCKYGRITEDKPSIEDLNDRMMALVYEVIQLENLEKAMFSDANEDLVDGPSKLRMLPMPPDVLPDGQRIPPQPSRDRP